MKASVIAVFIVLYLGVALAVRNSMKINGQKFNVDKFVRGQHVNIPETYKYAMQVEADNETVKQACDLLWQEGATMQIAENQPDDLDDQQYQYTPVKDVSHATFQRDTNFIIEHN